MKKKLIINGKNIFVFSETLLKVLNELEIAKSHNLAIAVNEKVVQKINWKKYKIKSGDIIEIVEPLKGG
ncbi:MAG: thiamine biosynthesis protein ThiS [Pelagibacteraceae bacterium]|nr:thiamine biosynthesis protein ThiS [Pelagibacteraceae bacterium]|tara:strand:+ start:13 stop:219 length:207 start_codon:yes stop_codon:yes gene_type:complete